MLQAGRELGHALKNQRLGPEHDAPQASRYGPSASLNSLQLLWAQMPASCHCLVPQGFGDLMLILTAQSVCRQS